MTSRLLALLEERKVQLIGEEGIVYGILRGSPTEKRTCVLVDFLVCESHREACGFRQGEKIGGASCLKTHPNRLSVINFITRARGTVLSPRLLLYAAVRRSVRVWRLLAPSTYKNILRTRHQGSSISRSCASRPNSFPLARIHTGRKHHPYQITGLRDTTYTPKSLYALPAPNSTPFYDRHTSYNTP